jgi:hypothetical protein
LFGCLTISTTDQQPDPEERGRETERETGRGDRRNRVKEDKRDRDSTDERKAIRDGLLTLLVCEYKLEQWIV